MAKSKKQIRGLLYKFYVTADVLTVFKHFR